MPLCRSLAESLSQPHTDDDSTVVQSTDSEENKQGLFFCVISWFTGCRCVNWALQLSPYSCFLLLLFFPGLVSAGCPEVSGSAEVRGHEESCLVRLVRQSLSSCWARSLWTVTKLRFSSVRHRNSSSRRAISMATFSSSTSSASSLRLHGQSEILELSGTGANKKQRTGKKLHFSRICI